METLFEKYVSRMEEITGRLDPPTAGAYLDLYKDGMGYQIKIIGNWNRLRLLQEEVKRLDEDSSNNLSTNNFRWEWIKDQRGKSAGFDAGTTLFTENEVEWMTELPGRKRCLRLTEKGRSLLVYHLACQLFKVPSQRRGGEFADPRAGSVRDAIYEAIRSACDDGPSEVCTSNPGGLRKHDATGQRRFLQRYKVLPRRVARNELQHETGMQPDDASREPFCFPI